MSLIQSATVVASTAGASNVVTLTGVTAGSLLVVPVSWAQLTNSTPPTAAGWNVAQNPAGQIFLGSAWVGSCIFYKENAPSGNNTITIVPSGTAAAMSAGMGEFTTDFKNGALDVGTNAGAVSGTSGNTGTTGSTTYPFELVIAVLGIADAAGTPRADCGISTPAATSFTSFAVYQNTSTTGIGLEASYKLVSSTGTQSGSWTWTFSSANVGTIATFKTDRITGSAYYLTA